MGVLGEIRLYDLVLFVHITAVVVAFGATFAYPFFQTVVERVSPRSVPAMLQAMHTSSRYLVTPGLLLVLASGIYLTVDGWDFGQRFVIVGLAVVVVLIVLGATFFDRHEVRLLSSREGTSPQREQARSCSAPTIGRYRSASPASASWRAC